MSRTTVFSCRRFRQIKFYNASKKEFVKQNPLSSKHWRNVYMERLVLEKRTWFHCGHVFGHSYLHIGTVWSSMGSSRLPNAWIQGSQDAQVSFLLAIRHCWKYWQNVRYWAATWFFKTHVPHHDRQLLGVIQSIITALYGLEYWYKFWAHREEPCSASRIPRSSDGGSPILYVLLSRAQGEYWQYQMKPAAR